MFKNNSYIIAVIFIVIIVLSSLSTYIYLKKSESLQLTEDILQEMMGVSSLNQIPIQKPTSQQDLPYTVNNDVKEFHLYAQAILWEYAKDQSFTAWSFNNQIPGPTIRVQENDTIRIIFHNNLPKPTTIHWHGLHVPASQDGLPGVSQEPIPAGSMFIYEFQAKPQGTRFYHAHGSSHGDEAQQLDMGLSGAFIIEPKQKTKSYDREYVLLLDEWDINKEVNNALFSQKHSTNYNLYTINGQAYPSILPLNVQENETILLRLINVGTSTTHPMHLHGHSFKIVAIDGNFLPEQLQYYRDTLPIAPGERYDLEFTANNPGVWVFHCHELHHAAGGMVIPLVYEGFSASFMNRTFNAHGSH